MQPENLRDEIKQELFLVLCEQPEERIISMHKAGQLRFFSTRIVLNMVQSNTSAFYKKFRKHCLVELTNCFGQESFDTNHDKHNEGFFMVEDNHNLSTSQDEELAIQQFEEDFALNIEATQKAINELHWYQRHILERYMQFGSANKFIEDMRTYLPSNISPIPKRTILDTVKKAKENVRARVKQIVEHKNKAA
jgi:hypothetical protein